MFTVMVKPDCQTIQQLASDYSIVPVCREVFADAVTPIALVRRLAALSESCFLLESVEGGQQWGRYSFLGFGPLMRVSCKEGIVTIEDQDTVKTIRTDRPLDILRGIQKEYRAPLIPDLPPFTGGFVGYFGYAMINYSEPQLKISRGKLNDYDFMLMDKVIIYDHLKQKICIVVNMRTDKVMENYGQATAELESIAAVITGNHPLPAAVSEKKVDFSCNVDKDEFCSMVETTQEFIRQGDIFQAVISRQFTAAYNSSLLSAYRVLRTTNPSPYMVYMNIAGDEIISTSPETLVRLHNGRLTTFPVAGSRPRGTDEYADLRLEQELLADEKELAEHNMLVDLGRNDLGKISKYASVKVTEYMSIRRYSTIMHICSQVESDILPQHDAYSAIEAILPAGTLSGAPKIRACEIIEEIEKEPRGIYGGALGYIDFSGNMDTCIAIRMAVKKDDTVYIQAGAGIVADSQPEREYEETNNKARAIIDAVCRAGEVDH